MNCPSCQRTNDPRRHYCGGCGANLAPVCRRCTFVNDATDRFCGGCGDLMTAPGAAVVAPAVAPAAAPLSLVPPAAARAAPPPAPRPSAPVMAAPPPPVLAAPVASVTPKRNDMITADDLAELLAQASAPAQAGPALPAEGAVSQDDLDKLFGAF